MTVVAGGHLRLQAQRHYESPADTEVMATGAPFVSVVRTGGPLGRSPAATYIRIPWNPRLANQAWLMSVQFVAKGLVKPKPSTWLGRTVSGPRNTVTLGFNDVGAPAMFSMYYWQREQRAARGEPRAAGGELRPRRPPGDRRDVPARRAS